MKTMVDVKPGEGRLVRLPNGKKLPPAGARLERTALIERWLANGDLVEIAAKDETGKGDKK